MSAEGVSVEAERPPLAPHHWRRALGGPHPDHLARLNDAEVLDSSDLHVALRVGDLAGETDQRVLLAVALAVRAVRHGSVCVDLATVADLAPDHPWPDAEEWTSALADSVLVDTGVLRFDLGLVYLDRYHRLELQVSDDLLAREAVPPPVVDEGVLTDTLSRVRGDHFSEEQQAAAVTATRRRTTVLTGGPGTGKTTTIARMLALIAAQHPTATGRPLSVALAAPTGKAATRLHEAVVAELAGLDDPELVALVGTPKALTLHRLLGWRPDNSTRFVHDRGNRLSHDVIVVDECSMVDLTMMGRLLEAVRPETRLVLVGDPRQLASVSAGAVLTDLVAGFGEGPESPVTALTRNFRSTEHIRDVAEALRAGDADAVLAALRRPGDEVEFLETDDAVSVLRAPCTTSAVAVREAAVVGDVGGAIAALDQHRLLCAHREGRFGVTAWNRQVELWLAEETGQPIYDEWYPGRPLLVTRNDYPLGLYNGETGAAVVHPDGRLRAHIAGSDATRDYAPGRLDSVETMHAMTIHKSQGSQALEVTVLLPEADSRLLTRELFYTALTRAQRKVRVVGSEEAVRAAVATQAQRATGLGRRLAQATSSPPLDGRDRNAPATESR